MTSSYRFPLQTLPGPAGSNPLTGPYAAHRLMVPGCPGAGFAMVSARSNTLSLDDVVRLRRVARGAGGRAGVGAERADGVGAQVVVLHRHVGQDPEARDQVDAAAAATLVVLRRRVAGDRVVDEGARCPSVVEEPAEMALSSGGFVLSVDPRVGQVAVSGVVLALRRCARSSSPREGRCSCRSRHPARPWCCRRPRCR